MLSLHIGHTPAHCEVKEARYLSYHGGSPGLEDPLNSGTSTFMLLVHFTFTSDVTISGKLNEIN